MALKSKMPGGFYGWVNLGAMFIFNMASMLVMMTFSMFLPFWVKEFVWSSGVISGASTLNMILMGFAAPVVGILIMKTGAKKAIIIGNLINLVGLVILAYMSEMWQLYIGYGIIIGIGIAIGGMLGTMTILNNWFIMKRTFALSISVGASMGFSGIFIIPYIMTLIQSIGWRYTYLVIAGVVLICCVIIPFIFFINTPAELGQVPDGPEKKTSGEMKFKDMPKLYSTPVDFTAKEALRTKTLWLLVAYNTLQMLAMGGLMNHQINYLIGIGFSPTFAAMAGAIMSGVMAVSQIVIGIIGLRINTHTMAVGSMLLTITAMAILLFTKNMTMVVAYSILFGIGFGIQFIALGTLFPNYFGMKEFPKIMGYMMPFSTIIGSFGQTLTGFIFDHTGSYSPAFELSLLMLILAFFCILFAKPPVHPSLKKGYSMA
jgi:MFS family permease